MGIMVYSLLWVMQDLYHQPYHLGFLFNFCGFLTTTLKKQACFFLLGG